MDDLKVCGWIDVDDHCPIDFTVHDDGVEVRFGSLSEGYSLYASERALATLIEESTKALHAMREQEAAPEEVHMR